jgi:DNA repair exonuclease SbcCD nuclease subunit
MKFAHLADCHIGGWREDKLKELGILVFERTIDIIIERNVGFVLISGDLFDTALPSIDLIKETARILDKLRKKNISVYVIPGSHDYSASGKTMLDVLEKAGLVRNVVRFRDGKLKLTEDKTGVKITGLYGKKGGLEKEEYGSLEIEEGNGFKIFMFHTAITEFKPSGMDKMSSLDSNKLPGGFNYYAGGHVHYIFEKDFGNGKLVFPGALFPNNFKELEEFENGGFYIVDDKLELEYVKVNLKEVKSLKFDFSDKKVEDVERELRGIDDVKDKIVALRLEGILEGRVSEIKFKKIFDDLYEKGAFLVLRNTNKLKSREFEEVEIDGDVENVEERVIEEYIGKIKINLDEKKLIPELMKIFESGKEEGEKNVDFEDRLFKNVMKVFKVET